MQKYFKKGRIVLAILFLIFILIGFSDIKGKLPYHFYSSVFYLQFLPSFLKFITPGTVLSVGFIVVIILTFIGGRVYCSTLCPLGIFQDIIIFLRRKFFPKKRYKYKKALNVLRYSILMLGVVSLFFGGILFINWLDPYSNFGRMASHIYQPILLKANNLLARIIPGIGLNPLEARPVHIASLAFAGGIMLLVSTMSFIQERLYCNSICPVGTFLGLISKISLFKIKIEQSSCTKCGKCQTVCKANCIDIKTLQVDESRCISCYNCIPVCNDNAIGYVMKKVQIPQTNLEGRTDARRRFILASAVGYIASRALPSMAQEPEGNHVCFYSRGTVSPSGSLSIEHLKDRCVACHLCISSCPTKVLQPTWLEYGITGMLMPGMDYSLSFCNYECTKCGEVCPTGAIRLLPKEEKKLTQIGKVQFVQSDCIVHNEGTACGSCSEHCPTQAVKMVPFGDGLTIPETDTSICIGCGACEYACPVTDPHKAIFVASNEIHIKVEKPVSKKIEYEETEDFPF